MTVKEFSDGFDVLVSSYLRFKDFDRRELLDSIEFNEYEKSLFLSKAQDMLVLSLYNGKNSSGDTFEGSEEMRRHLSALVKDALIDSSDDCPDVPIAPGSRFFHIPEDTWFLIYEGLKAFDEKCNKEKVVGVYPAKHDEYTRLEKNPFRGTNSNRALRLDLSDNWVEIVSDYSDYRYYIRYIRKLNPIVLVKLPEDMSIGGKGTADTPCECELHEGLHQQILELAVALALQSKGVGLSNNKEEKTRE